MELQKYRRKEETREKEMRGQMNKCCKERKENVKEKVRRGICM